jgi:cysteinyl-tRNA synthetase
MSDIVNLLREVAEIETGLLYSRRTMLKDAADEIDRLRSEHDAWRTAAVDQQERLKRAETERDSLKAMCDEMAKEARLQALEEAAKIAENEGNGSDDDYPGETWIAGQIAAAIRALAKAKEVENDR